MATPGGSDGAPKGQHLQASSSSSRSATTRSSSGLDEVTELTWHELETITSQFSEEVGRGGYGVVYKGKYNGYEIAVKKLHNMPELDDKAFANEFSLLMKVRHENIIRLVAYCYETKHKYIDINGELKFYSITERALCFEYMQRSLADQISEDSCKYDWATTYKIIRGTCEGLHYLHKGRGKDNHIYHLDLKPGNILLDKDMTPKITDFGLSRLFGESKTHKTSSHVKGTPPPEYIDDGAISPMNDVFSLGVIIFYLVAGKNRYSDYCDSRHSGQEFIERVQEYWKEKMRAEGPYYTWEEIDLLGVRICIKLAMRCVERARANRPSTEEIIDELQKLDTQIEKMSKKDSNSISGQISFGLSEFVEEVFGAYGKRSETILVISLTFVTNVRTYGPFGNPYHRGFMGKTNFRFMADEGSSIVGFHGRAGNHLFSIGVYMYPIPSNRTTVRALPVPVILDGQSLSTPTKSGPWGGSGGSDCDINEKPRRLTSLTVSYKGLIDALSFSYIDQAGKKQSVGPWGEGDNSNITKTIRFDPSEFVMELSGAYGVHKGIIIVKSLTFVTNERTYGPFGRPDYPVPSVSATEFRFMADEGSSIVGFYGGAGRRIDAIGVYTVQNCGP